MTLPVRLHLKTGPFIGTWRRYVTRDLASRPGAAVRGICRRCGEQTGNGGAAGWYYAHGQVWHPLRQLCPPCVMALGSERGPEAR
jgi:hypothetical protein